MSISAVPTFAVCLFLRRDVDAEIRRFPLHLQPWLSAMQRQVGDYNTAVGRRRSIRRTRRYTIDEPAAVSVLPDQAGPQTRRGGIDKPFGTSFDLGTARTFCAATLEMNLRRESNPLDWNDKVYVYLGTIAAPNLVISAYAWPSSTLPSPRVVKIPLPSSILTSLAPGRYLSVILQDDTAVDYVRLVYSWK